MPMNEYRLENVTILGGKPIHEQLKKFFDDGWLVHSWQYKVNTNHEIGVMLTRSVWGNESQIEEKPARKFIGMKGKDAL